MNIIKNMLDKYNYEIVLENDKKDKFKMHYAGCDLYWTMLDYYDNNEFYITKKEELLFVQIKEIFSKIRECDNSHSKLLNNNSFEWISEAYGIPEESNKLIITESEERFTIKFYQNSNRIFNTKSICSICFCLSGSRNQKIANAFSIMLHKLSELDTNRKVLIKK